MDYWRVILSASEESSRNFDADERSEYPTGFFAALRMAELF
jgi:hypothetical protein